ncbi:MAG: hypothetical protein KBD64_08275 [Gammaproteobacteria bacterium]|nr:hypothetical protein [Gammaproteobacteria bacterium]
MDKAEIDRLSIKRDSLLKKKRLLDAIKKLSEDAPKGKTTLRTNCYYLTDAIKTELWDPFINLMEAIEDQGAIGYTVSRSNGSPWGESIVDIDITDKFDKIHKEIGEKYHDINDTLDNKKIKTVSSASFKNDLKISTSWYKDPTKQWVIGIIISILLAVFYQSTKTTNTNLGSGDVVNGDKNDTQIINGNGDNVAGDKIIIYRGDIKLRPLDTAETGKKLSDISSNVYFFVDPITLSYYYDDPSAIEVRKTSKNNTYFQVQKTDNYTIAIGYINSENYSNLGTLSSKNPMKITIFPFPLNEYKNLVGIPLLSIKTAEQRYMEFDKSGVQVIDMTINQALTDIKQY